MSTTDSCIRLKSRGNDGMGAEPIRRYTPAGAAGMFTAEQRQEKIYPNFIMPWRTSLYFLMVLAFVSRETASLDHGRFGPDRTGLTG